jgi:hypothetical protein
MAQDRLIERIKADFAGAFAGSLAAQPTSDETGQAEQQESRVRAS